MKIRYKILLLSLPVVCLLTLGLGWLALGVLTFGSILLLFSSSMKWVGWVKRNSWLSGTLSLLGIFTIAILLRLFVFEIFTIPSSSMEDTLQPGDHIILSKLNYGPSLPRSPFEIPWLNLFFFLNQEARAKAGTEWWDYNRLEGYSSIERNDIVIFKQPHLYNMPFIKRCIGLPGEEFQMIQGQAFCNGEQINAPSTVKNLYQLWPKEEVLLRKQLDNIQVRLLGLPSRDSIWEVYLNEEKRNFLSTSPAVDSLKFKPLKPGEGIAPFPRNEKYDWSIDHFGPVHIPAKGMRIRINADNLLFYSHILREFEQVKIEEQDGRYYLNGKEIREYIFTQNYYFMLGDHRNDSEDSRFLGFIPEENIIGKASCILFSKNYEGFKWNRMLKILE